MNRQTVLFVWIIHAFALKNTQVFDIFITDDNIYDNNSLSYKVILGAAKMVKFKNMKGLATPDCKKYTQTLKELEIFLKENKELLGLMISMKLL